LNFSLIGNKENFVFRPLREKMIIVVFSVNANNCIWGQRDFERDGDIMLSNIGNINAYVGMYLS